MEVITPWRARQILFSTKAETFEHKFRDDLADVEISWKPDTIVDDAVLHFNEKVNEWIYPAKSYFVAICYAKWISADFYEDFYEVLDHPDLLPNDPHFKPYSEAKEIYDSILNKIEWSPEEGMAPDVYEYYREEMLIDEYPIDLGS